MNTFILQLAIFCALCATVWSQSFPALPLAWDEMICGSSNVVAFGGTSYVQALGGLVSDNAFCGTLASGTISVPTSKITTTIAAGYIFTYPPSTGFTIEFPANCDLGMVVYNRDCGAAGTCNPLDVTRTTLSYGTTNSNYCRYCNANDGSNLYNAYSFIAVAALPGSALPMCSSFTVKPYTIYSGVACTSCPGGSYPGGATTGCQAPPAPTAVPTPLPTRLPTPLPTAVPSAVPTPLQTPVPTPVPSQVPTEVPTEVPTVAPGPSDPSSKQATAGSSSSSTGAIIGAIAGVLVLGGAGYFYYQQRALARKAAENATKGLDMTTNKI